MSIIHVSLAFAKFTDSELVSFTEGVVSRIADNPSFPTPPVTLADLQNTLNAFLAALASMAQGGTQATAIKNAARETLLEALRKEANYVQGASNNNLATLLSSGFENTSTTRTRGPLATPGIVEIDNEESTQLLLRLTKVDNAKAYEVRISSAPGQWQQAGVFTQARRVILEGLTPGTLYTVQARAVGGTTGYSGWSDPVTHMSL